MKKEIKVLKQILNLIYLCEEALEKLYGNALSIYSNALSDEASADEKRNNDVLQAIIYAGTVLQDRIRELESE